MTLDAQKLILLIVGSLSGGIGGTGLIYLSESMRNRRRRHMEKEASGGVGRRNEVALGAIVAGEPAKK
jgi:hypothetical protein